MATVRRGTEGDLPAIRRIQTAALAEPWPAILDLAAGEGGSWLRVIAVDGQVLGYAIAVTAANPDAYLPEIAIAPAHQGDGLGSQLLRSLLDELAEASYERVRVTARADDDRVHAFYETHGFEAVERVPDHFESGDGVVFERVLAPSD